MTPEEEKKICKNLQFRYDLNKNEPELFERITNANKNNETIRTMNLGEEQAKEDVYVVEMDAKKRVKQKNKGIGS